MGRQEHWKRLLNGSGSTNLNACGIRQLKVDFSFVPFCSLYGVICINFL
jgi:hypothetical protein